MGYNSSPIVSMLLTLFNARLGWWLGNPRTAGNGTYWRSGPGNSAKYLIDEDIGAHQRRKALRVPVGRRPFRKPRLVRDGAEAMPERSS